MLPDIRNMQTIAYDKLKEMIVTLELKPGEKITLNKIIDTLGIGRTPIREAIIKFKDQNLVKVIPQSGTYISKIDLKQAEDAMFVRKLIEKKIVAMAINKDDNDLKNKLAKILDFAKAKENQQDKRNFFHFDNEFHKSFYTAVDKEDIWNWMQTLNIQLERFRYLRLSVEDLQWSTIIEQHESIFNAVINKDIPLGTHEIENHLSMMFKEEEELISAYPDYFTNLTK